MRSGGPGPRRRPVCPMPQLVGSGHPAYCAFLPVPQAPLGDAGGPALAQLRLFLAHGDMPVPGLGLAPRRFPLPHCPGGSPPSCTGTVPVTWWSLGCCSGRQAPRAPLALALGPAPGEAQRGERPGARGPHAPPCRPPSGVDTWVGRGLEAPSWPWWALRMHPLPRGAQGHPRGPHVALSRCVGGMSPERGCESERVGGSPGEEPAQETGTVRM